MGGSTVELQVYSGECLDIGVPVSGLALVLTPGLTEAQVTVLEVGLHGTYDNIQDAIDAAGFSDDTEIRVEGASTYVENHMISPSFSGGSLTLLGGWNMDFTGRVLDILLRLA